MPEPNVRGERIQFSLRAMFLLTLLAAVLVTVARWLFGLEGSGPILASMAIGLSVGLATVLIVQHVRLTCLLVTLILGLVGANGFWFSGQMIAYGCGVFAGAFLAWKGLPVFNTLLGWCGFTVSKSGRPQRKSPEE
jgi:hypothetical protein